MGNPEVIFKTFLKQCTQSFNGTVLQKSLQPSKIPQSGLKFEKSYHSRFILPELYRTEATKAYSSRRFAREMHIGLLSHFKRMVVVRLAKYKSGKWSYKLSLAVVHSVLSK